MADGSQDKHCRPLCDVVELARASPHEVRYEGL